MNVSFHNFTHAGNHVVIHAMIDTKNIFNYIITALNVNDFFLSKEYTRYSLIFIFGKVFAKEHDLALKSIKTSGKIFMFHVYHQRVFLYAKTKHFHLLFFFPMYMQ